MNPLPAHRVSLLPTPWLLREFEMDLFTRSFFTAEHREFREQVRRFVAARIAPFHAQWEEAGCVPREIFREAGALGMLCCTVASEWGGSGADYLFTVVALEEMADAHAPGPGFGIHSEMATPYVSNFGSARQKAHWLPRLVSGDAIAGVALTEPGAGSDLKRIRTRAIRTPDGWRLSGQKVFISNGQLADLFVVAAKTEDQPGLSMFLVDASRPGVRRGQRLKKLGHHAQDTSELFFDEVPLLVDDCWVSKATA